MSIDPAGWLAIIIGAVLAMTVATVMLVLSSRADDRRHRQWMEYNERQREKTRREISRINPGRVDTPEHTPAYLPDTSRR